MDHGCEVDVVPDWDGERPLIVIRGTLDGGSVDALEVTLNRVRLVHASVVLDLAAVEVINPEGLWALLRWQGRFNRVELAARSLVVAQALRFTQVERLFPEFHPDGARNQG